MTSIRDHTVQPSNVVQYQQHTLWYLGNLALLSLPCLSVIGTRDPTIEGTLRTKRIVKIAVEHGFCIVSGLAAGIDTAAHEQTLELKGQTIAVMGTPIDQCYPKENEPLKKCISERGLVLSQFALDSKVHRSNFPKRNALMAELSAVTIVTEAGEFSGTRHQVKSAQRLGKKIGFLASIVDRNYPWVVEALNSGNGFIIEGPADLAAVLALVHRSTPQLAIATQQIPPKVVMPQQLNLLMDEPGPSAPVLSVPAPMVAANIPVEIIVPPHNSATSEAPSPSVLGTTNAREKGRPPRQKGFGRLWETLRHYTVDVFRH